MPAQKVQPKLLTTSLQRDLVESTAHKSIDTIVSMSHHPSFIITSEATLSSLRVSSGSVKSVPPEVALSYEYFTCLVVVPSSRPHI